MEFWLGEGRESGLFYCGEMGGFRLVGSEIFADECGGMTIPWVVGTRSFFGEKIPLYRKNITLWLKGDIFSNYIKSRFVCQVKNLTPIRLTVK